MQSLKHKYLQKKVEDKRKEIIFANADILWAEDCIEYWNSMSYQDIKQIAQKEWYSILIAENINTMRGSKNQPLYKMLNTPINDPVYFKINAIISSLSIIIQDNFDKWTNKRSTETHEQIESQCKTILKWWLRVLTNRTRWVDPSKWLSTFNEVERWKRNNIWNDEYHYLLNLKEEDFHKLIHHLIYKKESILKAA